MNEKLDSNNLDYSDKILNCFGDSTTWGDNGMDTGGEDISWVHHIQKLVKFKDVRNYGVCASRIAVTEDRTDSFIERINDMRTDADYIVVMGGVNDFQHNVPLDNPRSKDIWTFYGALNVLSHELLDQFPSARIIFITPMKNNFHHPTKKYPTTLDKNTQGFFHWIMLMQLKQFVIIMQCQLLICMQRVVSHHLIPSSVNYICLMACTIRMKDTQDWQKEFIKG